MKKNWLLIGGVALATDRGGVDGQFSKPKSDRRVRQTRKHHTPVARTHEHSPSAAAKTIPAHFEAAPSRSSLGPTLDPGAVQRHNSRCVSGGARDPGDARAVAVLLPLRSGLWTQESLQLFRRRSRVALRCLCQRSVAGAEARERTETDAGADTRHHRRAILTLACIVLV